MLFNSQGFIYVFVPLALLGFFVIGRHSPVIAAAWLTAASLFFYGWWDARYVMLLALSILFNYTVGTLIAASFQAQRPVAIRCLLWFGVAANLLVLGYYKYAGLLVSTADAILGSRLGPLDILLPLGISFFTFTQIAFLVDASRGEAKEYNPVHYALFVSYFPHLIAGPLLHHKEMMPQFARRATYKVSLENFSVGISIFGVGLFKKVVLADGIAPFVAQAFGPGPPDLGRAWCGSLAFALQLYFDFSGYCDMAIGLSRLFGVVLPLNFNSPYKSDSIIEFWRRWHMTLSRFLRDYLYIPLGGGRHGGSRRYLNLMLTMLLGGLWHGASWTFALWGGLHGIYLVLNHAWRAMRDRYWPNQRPRPLALFGARGLTFLCVVLAWVVFRAPDLHTAIGIFRGMFGGNGVSLPVSLLVSLGKPGAWLQGLGVRIADEANFGVNWILALLAIAWFLPNTQQVFARFRPGLGGYGGAGEARFLRWAPNLLSALITGLLTYEALIRLTKVSEFLYFQF